MKLYILGLLLIIQFGAEAQILVPVKWTFTNTKISTNVYDLHFKAFIKSGWHIYSQKQPQNSVATPLNVVFEKNKSIKFINNIKEVGKLSKHHEKSIGVTNYQYSNNLDVIQRVEILAGSKTVIKGTLTYQTCNDKQCLAPEDEFFEIRIN
jgi:thiol:disulfide interchange protein DsbD